ncbi:MAG: DUF4157 domain-containing protein, partial [Anaerolineales bacterium]|nr:DUF4157 domain-containing protein [Anaerolineales bacterium]
MATRQVHDQGQAKRVGRARETTKPAVSGKDLAAPTRVLQQTVADPAAAAPSDILALQQAYGNQAVVGLLAPQVAEHAGSPLPIQAKLIVGPVDDPYEREADRVAERVTQISPTTDSPPVQRYAEDEEELQMKPLVAHQGPSGVGPVQGKGLVQRYAEEEEELQTKPLAVRHKMAFEADDGLVQRLCSLKGGGAPLPDHVRADMEARFGANFSNVRVHADAEAGQLNQAIRARAFTHGTDVYFTYGQYNPESINGKRLLAHELTHVIQQTGQGPRELAAGATGKSKRVSSRVESAQAANPSRVPGSLHTVQRDGDQPSLEDEEEKRRQQGTSLVPPKPTKPLPPLPVQGR